MSKNTFTPRGRGDNPLNQFPPPADGKNELNKRAEKATGHNPLNVQPTPPPPNPLNKK